MPKDKKDIVDITDKAKENIFYIKVFPGVSPNSYKN